MNMIKVICVGCSHQFETPHPDETPDYATCPQCGDGRIWKDNEETRRILRQRPQDPTLNDKQYTRPPLGVIPRQI